MPRSILFAPAALATLDQFSQRVSLLLLVESLNGIPMEHSEDAPEERKAYRYLAPGFTIVSVWFAQDEDEGKEFEQRVLFIAPDDRETQLGELTRFSMTTPFHRVFQGTTAVALRIPGLYQLRLQLRVVGEEGWPDEYHNVWPFIVPEIAAPDPLAGLAAVDAKAANVHPDSMG